MHFASLGVLLVPEGWKAPGSGDMGGTLKPFIYTQRSNYDDTELVPINEFLLTRTSQKACICLYLPAALNLLSAQAPVLKGYCWRTYGSVWERQKLRVTGRGNWYHPEAPCVQYAKFSPI